jgi:hypothetical protein
VMPSDAATFVRVGMAAAAALLAETVVINSSRLRGDGFVGMAQWDARAAVEMAR